MNEGEHRASKNAERRALDYIRESHPIGAGEVGELSVRTLARAIGVSKTTASRALRQLEQHGHIVRVTRGTGDGFASEWRMYAPYAPVSARAVVNACRGSLNTDRGVRGSSPFRRTIHNEQEQR